MYYQDYGMMMASVREILSAQGIDSHLWETRNGCKTLQHLVRELSCGEASLVIQNGGFRRFYKRAAGRIYCMKNGKLFRLYERKQVFKGGGFRVRPRSLSISEKLLPRESFHGAIKRCLAEELGLLKQMVRIQALGEVSKEKMSKAYPGLMNLYLQSSYNILFSPDEWREEYREDQCDKTVFFSWEKLPTSRKNMSAYIQVKTMEKQRCHHVVRSKRAIDTMRPGYAYSLCV